MKLYTRTFTMIAKDGYVWGRVFKTKDGCARVVIEDERNHHTCKITMHIVSAHERHTKEFYGTRQFLSHFNSSDSDWPIICGYHFDKTDVYTNLAHIFLE